MLLLAKGLLGLSLGWVFVQDLNHRRVYAFLFPLAAILSGYLFFTSVRWEVLLLSIATNALIVISILLILIMFLKLRNGTYQLESTLGWGDVLFFGVLGVSFPTISFINVFVFSCFFALAVHSAIRFLGRAIHDRSIPLAGYMALFVLGVYLAHWLGWYQQLYLL